MAKSKMKFSLRSENVSILLLLFVLVEWSIAEKKVHETKLNKTLAKGLLDQPRSACIASCLRIFSCMSCRLCSWPTSPSIFKCILGSRSRCPYLQTRILYKLYLISLQV